MPAFAIVGSGPAGCYLAAELARGAKGARIDVFERLGEPFGLVRFGVAPDHPGTRAVSRVLGRPFDRGLAQLHLGTEVGTDVALADLRREYGAVVLATGAPTDRRLGVPGEDLATPSGSFIRWINGHPEMSAPPNLGTTRRAVVIGAGNVALDAVRLLAKHRRIPGLGDMPLEGVDLLARGGPGSARFTAPELSELLELEDAHVSIAGQVGPSDGKGEVTGLLGRLSATATRRPGTLPVRLHFGVTVSGFHAEDGRLLSVATDMGTFPAELAVSCIGYRRAPVDGIEPAGRGVAPGLYAVGWAARGPTGTIPTNRSEAQALARQILTR